MAKQTLDFTNVKEGGGAFRKTRQPAGDYAGKITKVQTVKKKNDESGAKQWLFTVKVGGGIYPYYCGFEENVLWKIRNLFVAAGINIPKKRVSIDPERIVGKTVGITLEDDEYDGKKQSSIAAVFPPSELEDGGEGDDDEDEDDDESSDDDDTSDDEDDDEDEEPEPPKKAKKTKGAKKSKKASSDDDNLEELDIDDI